MNVKYTINSKYEKKYKNFVLNIKDYFNNAEKTIHKARNEIKIISFEEKQFVVKSFKKPSLIKSIYYAKNNSKAKRSYEYSIKLKDFTPEAIAYIEFYENNKLSNSFYISEYFEYDYTIKEPLREIGFKNKTKVLEEFAIFSSKLHDNGILHLDYSAGNILIKEIKDKYIFKVVDVNRMIFKPLNLNEKLKNFDMLWASNENMIIIATQYAKSNNLNIEMVVKKAIYYSFRLKLFKNFKKLLKGKIKNIDW
jgi:tRNA A-37 threonylcarbamoyl transferase component Bud32